MEQKPKIDFGAWLPDLPAMENPGALLVKNCIPQAMSYRSINDLLAFTDPLADPVLGSFWIRAKNGTLWNFAATDDAVYLYDGASGFDDVSGPSAPFSANRWDFTNFQERVVATSGGADPIQYFDVGVPSATFDDLPEADTRGLRCTCLGTVADFLLAGNFEDVLGEEPGGFAWSGFNNTELWTPSRATQAGRRESRGNGGKMQRIVSGSTGVGMRENSVELLRYVGPPVIWSVTDITTSHGTQAPRSVCWTSNFVFYHSQEGFMKYDRLQNSLSNIGQDRVNDWFFRECPREEVVNMVGTIDRLNKLVFWQFRSNTSSPFFDRVLVLDYVHTNFSYLELDTQLLAEFISPGYNLDTIGAILGGDIDSASISVDDPTFQGGEHQLAGFTTLNELATFSGEALVAEIDTKELGPSEFRRGYVNGVRPIVEGDSNTIIEIAPLVRNLLTEVPVLGSFFPLNEVTNLVDLRVNARLHRYRTRISGGFTHARRIELDPKPRGRR